jgi:hypothetical protein
MNYKSCPSCGRKTKKLLFSNWFWIKTCLKCGKKYCGGCSSNGCPECQSTKNGHYVYSAQRIPRVPLKGNINTYFVIE